MTKTSIINQDVFHDEQELLKVFDGDMDLLIFYVTWLKNGLNATKAYIELHPHVTYGSAEVLGSRWLRKVRKNHILEAYGLDIIHYLQQLQEGLHATKIIHMSVLIREDGKIINVGKKAAIEIPDYMTRFYYMETLGKLLGLEGKCK